jgi:DNA (cytosine-5)-methyltransferase 1
MRHGSLFSGIGGFDLAAQWMNWTNVFHTEWNEFGQKILQHHFPQSISYHDIIKTDYTIHKGTIDIITGGFPCQPFSLAGKRKGKDDERYLWHEMLRAIQQIQPTYVVAENVRGLLTIDGGMVFEQVCADLEAEGYEVQPILLPAAGVNAPHRRDRIFIVAYSKHNRHQAIRRKEEEENGISGINRSEMGARQSDRTDIRPTAANTKDQRTGRLRNESSKEGTRFCDVVSGKPCGLSVSTEPAANTKGKRYAASTDRWQGISAQEEQALHGRSCDGTTHGTWQNFPTESAICGGNDGLSNRLDNITFPKWRNESIKAYGNAVVPQLILPIFQTIEKLHREKK